MKYLILALALSMNLAQANIINTSTTTPTAVSCTQFCNQFANTPTTLNSNAWGTADDQMCFLLGAPTSDDPTINVTPQKMPTLPTGMVDRCKYHNSQTEQYCLAYLAIEGNTSNKTDAGVAAQDVSQQVSANYGSKAINIALLTLDYATVGACTAACFAGPASAGVLNGICAASAIGEGIFEMTQTARMASDSTAAAIDTAFAGMTMVGGVASLNRAKNAANEAGQRVVVSGEKFGAELKDMSALDKAKSNKESCTTAVMMSVVAGIRTANVVGMNSISSQVCSNIQNLLSQGGTVGSSPSNITQAPAPTTGGSNGVSAFGAQSVLNAIAQCNQSGSSACQAGNAGCCLSSLLPTASTGNGSAATEGNLLSQIPSVLSSMPGLTSAATEAPTSGAGSPLASMGGGSVPSGFMNSLADIANNAQKDADKLAGALGIQMASAPVYSSGGSTVAKASTGSLFDSLMKKESPTRMAKNEVIQFTKPVVQKSIISIPTPQATERVLTFDDIPTNTGNNTIFPQGTIQGGSDNVAPKQNPLKGIMVLIGVAALGAFLIIRNNRRS